MEYKASSSGDVGAGGVTSAEGNFVRCKRCGYDGMAGIMWETYNEWEKED
jgi:hypothetical protein